MPNSCRSILTRLLRSKRIKQWEHDKLLRNLKGIEWHPFPQEKPSETECYIVTVKTNWLPNFSTEAFYNATQNQWYEANTSYSIASPQVIAWAELPEPYKEANDERNN